MCGFVGMLNPRRLPRTARLNELRRMLDMIAYRGPDDEQCYVDERIALGFRRLAIIDVAGGAQPIGSEDGQVIAVLNGEIYNFVALARQLEAKGHRFRTRCDAEVIVHAYEEWDADYVHRLEGMFAIAVWDRRRGRVVLARDRSGIKPLVYGHFNREFRFASEAKALLAGHGVDRALDVGAIFGQADCDALSEPTSFRGIEQLAPGCMLVADRSGTTSRRYWSYAPTVADDGLTVKAHLDRFEAAVDDAIASHLVSDVPVSAYLSGGIDSSIVVAQMQRQLGRVTTFTTVFDRGPRADQEHVHALARRLGLGTLFVATPSDEKVAPLLPLVAWLAEGDLDAGYVSRLLLSHAARRRGFKVVLSGQGIDEILTGYHPSFEHFARQAVFERSSAVSRQMAPLFSRPEPRSAIADEEIVSRLRRDHAQLSRGLLRFEDRMAMANGVELRVPYLDRRVLEAAAAFPPRLRARLMSDKAALRCVAAKWLPSRIARRRKFAFNGNTLPLTRLARESALVRRLLSRETLRSFGYFDPRAVLALTAGNNYHLLDRVLVCQLMHEIFVRDFDPKRFAQPAALLEPHATDELEAAPPIRNRAPRATTVPSLSPSVTSVRATYLSDPACRLAASPWATVVFAEGARTPQAIPKDGVEVLRWIDGRRTYGAIKKKLGRSVTLAGLLEFGYAIGELGIVDHHKRHK